MSRYDGRSPRRGARGPRRCVLQPVINPRQLLADDLISLFYSPLDIIVVIGTQYRSTLTELVYLTLLAKQACFLTRIVVIVYSPFKICKD